MADPYGALWPCLFRDSGVVGCTAATPRLITVMWMQPLWVQSWWVQSWSAFFMAGFWESVVLGPAPWSRLSRIFFWGRFLRLGRLLGVGPGDSRPGEGGPMLRMLEGLNDLIIF